MEKNRCDAHSSRSHLSVFLVFLAKLLSMFITDYILHIFSFVLTKTKGDSTITTIMPAAFLFTFFSQQSHLIKFKVVFLY